MRTLLLLLMLAPAVASAQSSYDCNSDAARPRGLLRGETFTAPCDSMVVLNRPSYERLYKEEARMQRVVDLSDAAIADLEEIVDLQSRMMEVQELDLRAVERHDSTLRAINLQLDAKLEESIENTEQAVAIARRNKTLGVLLGGATGIILGLLVGAAAF